MGEDEPAAPEVVFVQDFCVAHTKMQAFFACVTSIFTLASRAVDREGTASAPVVPLFVSGGKRPLSSGAGMSGASSNGGATPVGLDPSSAGLLRCGHGDG